MFNKPNSFFLFWTLNALRNIYSNSVNFKQCRACSPILPYAKISLFHHTFRFCNGNVMYIFLHVFFFACQLIYTFFYLINKYFNIPSHLLHMLDVSRSSTVIVFVPGSFYRNITFSSSENILLHTSKKEYYGHNQYLHHCRYFSDLAILFQKRKVRISHSFPNGSNGSIGI